MTSNILPPPKKDVLAWLGIPIVPGKLPAEPPAVIPRRAETDVSRSMPFIKRSIILTALFDALVSNRSTSDVSSSLTSLLGQSSIDASPGIINAILCVGSQNKKAGVQCTGDTRLGWDLDGRSSHEASRRRTSSNYV